MPLIVGHSQAKYLSDYLDFADFSVCSFSGYDIGQFIREEVLDLLYPCFSDIVLLVGANDINVHTPSQILEDIADLCSLVHGFAPSATVYMCEVLPRGVNHFPGRHQSNSFLRTWNRDAATVNSGIRSLAETLPWLQVIHLPEFHTLYGLNRRLLSKDGLHLSFEGTATLAGRISAATLPTTITAPPATPPTITAPSTTPPTITAPSTTPPTITAPPTTPPTITAPPMTPPTITAPPTTPPTITAPPVTPPTITAPPVTPPTITAPSTTPPTITAPPTTPPTITAPPTTPPTTTEGPYLFADIVKKGMPINSAMNTRVKPPPMKSRPTKKKKLVTTPDNKTARAVNRPPPTRTRTETIPTNRPTRTNHTPTKRLDSLGEIKDRDADSIISNGLKIQLSQIYGKEKTSLTIKVPSVCKQTNNIDCGLYAIAFVTAYCFRKTLCFDLAFDTSKLRSHLISCFENAKMTEFPLKNKRVYLSKKRPKCSREIEIKNYCVCNLPLCVDNVVCCDRCELWYHKHCVSAPINVSSVDTDFVCETCT